MVYQGALYYHHTPTGKLEDVLWFIVPKAHWVAAMNGCHHDAGHQGQQQTLFLLHDQFWWPGMAAQMQKAINSCKWCIQHEGIHAKAPVWSIIFTAPLELLHIDFTSIETMTELDQPPNMVNVLVFWDHFMKHIMTYITPNQTVKTVARFCDEVASWSSECQPSSWVTKEPTLKAMLSESFVSVWACRRLGLHLTMLKTMDRWNELTKHWCTW